MLPQDRVVSCFFEVPEGEAASDYEESDIERKRSEKRTVVEVVPASTETSKALNKLDNPEANLFYVDTDDDEPLELGGYTYRQVLDTALRSFVVS